MGGRTADPHDLVQFLCVVTSTVSPAFTEARFPISAAAATAAHTESDISASARTRTDIFMPMEASFIAGESGAV